mmetsp:Transcript_15280/g.48140  ORF Transcript_15280/g.48140 Transcript_15280/m.48140 type:complete len:218 (-) Transcript_15280:713-1366(-)
MAANGPGQPANAPCLLRPRRQAPQVQRVPGRVHVRAPDAARAHGVLHRAGARGADRRRLYHRSGRGRVQGDGARARAAAAEGAGEEQLQPLDPRRLPDHRRRAGRRRRLGARARGHGPRVPEGALGLGARDRSPGPHAPPRAGGLPGGREPGAAAGGLRAAPGARDPLPLRRGADELRRRPHRSGELGAALGSAVAALGGEDGHRVRLLKVPGRAQC